MSPKKNKCSEKQKQLKTVNVVSTIRIQYVYVSTCRQPAPIKWMCKNANNSRQLKQQVRKAALAQTRL